MPRRHGPSGFMTQHLKRRAIMGFLFAGLWMSNHVPNLFAYGMTLLFISWIASLIYWLKTDKENNLFDNPPLTYVSCLYFIGMIFVPGPM